MAQPKNPVPNVERVMEEVFITPRVIDRGALEDYSTTLQDLIREAAGRGESLATASTDVKALGESLREATKELKSRLEVAVKIIPTLEQRLGKADQILQLTTDRVKLAEHLDKTIESLMAERLAQVERRAAAIIESAEQREAALQATSKARLDEAVESATARLEALALAKVAESQERIAGAHREVVERSESAAAGLGPRLAALETATNTMERDVATRLGSIERGMSESLGTLRSELSLQVRAAAELVATTSAARSGWKTELDAAEARAREVSRTLRESAAASANLVRSELAEQVGEQLRDQLRTQLHDQLHGQLHDQLHTELRVRIQAGVQAKLTEFEVIASALARSVTEKSAASSRAMDERLDARLGDGLRRMEDLAALAAARVDDVARLAEAARVEQVRTPEVDHSASIESLRDLIERAERLMVGADGSSLSAMVSRGEDLRASAVKAANQFDEIRKQADLARVMLGDWINTTATRIDEENARNAALQNSIEASAARIESARQTQEQLARTLSQTIELAQQAATMLGNASLGGTPTPVAAQSLAPLGPVGEPSPVSRSGELPQAARDALDRVRNEIQR